MMPNRKLTLKRRYWASALLFIALFTAMTFQQRSIFATGANVSELYGWPAAWLQVHHFRTFTQHDLIVERVNRLEEVSITDWDQCIMTVFIAAASSATIVVLPLIFRARSPD